MVSVIFYSSCSSSLKGQVLASVWQGYTVCLSILKGFCNTFAHSAAFLAMFASVSLFVFQHFFWGGGGERGVGKTRNASSASS